MTPPGPPHPRRPGPGAPDRVPGRLVVGLGTRDGTPVARLRAAVAAALAEARVTAAQVGILATVDRRAAAEAVRALARDFDWALAGLSPGELAGQAVPTPSTRVALALGTASVAEAAALIAAGPGATLLLPKRIHHGVTIAIATRP